VTLHLVLIPGLATDAHLFDAQSKGLAQLAAVTVATHGGEETISAMAARVLAAAPPRFALGGLSMGGYVALEIVRQAPSRVTVLALLDTTAAPETEEATRRRLALVALARQGRLDAVHGRLWERLVHPARRDDRALEDVVRRMLEETGAENFERQQRAIIGRMDSRPFLPRIGVPALVLAGEEDAITPPEVARAMADAIPGAELVLVKECGHLSALEQPEAVTAALSRWLARVGDAPSPGAAAEPRRRSG
jgi:pimeloyl-ACP methyl ester carboxylesterase